MKLYAASWKTGRTLQALRIASTWAENAVAWNNQPATIGSAATASSGSNWRQWNVGSQVQAMFDNNAPHGFLLRDATESGGGNEQQFHGREKNDKIPQLVITYGTATVSGASFLDENRVEGSDPNGEEWVDSGEQAPALYLPVIQNTAGQQAQAQPADMAAAAVDADQKTAESTEGEQADKIHLPMITR